MLSQNFRKIVNPFKSGFVAIIGRPNVGKSTLLNALMGQELAVVCSKPQTTRNRILGVKTLPGAQMLFLDTPGIHRPHKSLNAYMVEMAEATFDDADVFLFVTESSEVIAGEEMIAEEDRQIYEKILQKGKPVIVIINKVDKTFKKNLLPLMHAYLQYKPSAVIPISALKLDGISRIEEAILEVLPEGPTYYPEDQVTDRSERFLVAEIIRQNVMDLTKQEIPYSVAVVVEEFREPRAGEERPLTHIRATIVVEKDSQKGILIGAKGSMIKKIGELSRGKIEPLLETRVYLELFVRVEKDWAQDPAKVEALVGS